jgi:hypothetical protein
VVVCYGGPEWFRCGHVTALRGAAPACPKAIHHSQTVRIIQNNHTTSCHNNLTNPMLAAIWIKAEGSIHPKAGSVISAKGRFLHLWTPTVLIQTLCSYSGSLASLLLGYAGWFWVLAHLTTLAPAPGWPRWTLHQNMPGTTCSIREAATLPTSLRPYIQPLCSSSCDPFLSSLCIV